MAWCVQQRGGLCNATAVHYQHLDMMSWGQGMMRVLEMWPMDMASLPRMGSRWSKGEEWLGRRLW